MIKIGIDFDDVLAPLNCHAIDLANHDYPERFASNPLTVDDIDSWENNGRTAVIKEYYDKKRLFELQYVPDEAKAFMKELQTRGKVYIISAMKPQVMSIRAKQIHEAFPDFPEENVILGSAKDLIQVDVLLDDRPHNVHNSMARFPVLYRQPWNREVTGTLAVNNYSEFLQLLDQIKQSMIENVTPITCPSVIALVGPSGSNKSEMIKALCRDESYSAVPSFTTNPNNTDKSRKYVDPKAFDCLPFFETSMYGGYAYGTFYDDIQKTLDEGKFAVIALDMCGAIAMKKEFPTAIVFCNRDRENMVESLLEHSRDKMSPHELTLRIVSMETEVKNADLCDYIVDTENVEAAVSEIKTVCSFA